MTAKTLASLGRCTLAALMLAMPASAQTAPGVCLPAPRQVQINVHWVQATAAQYNAARHKAKRGEQHDAQLLTALLKGGAQDEQGPQITTTDGVQATINLQAQIASSLPPSTLTSLMQVKPHVNTNGSITAELDIKRDELAPVVPDISPPVPFAKNTQASSSQRVFSDGQTLVVGDANTVDTKTDLTTRGLVFVTVSLVALPQKPSTQH